MKENKTMKQAMEMIKAGLNIILALCKNVILTGAMSLFKNSDPEKAKCFAIVGIEGMVVLTGLLMVMMPSSLIGVIFGFAFIYGGVRKIRLSVQKGHFTWLLEKAKVLVLDKKFRVAIGILECIVVMAGILMIASVNSIATVIAGIILVPIGLLLIGYSEQYGIFEGWLLTNNNED